MLLCISYSFADTSCRSRLASLNEKLTALERQVEYLEARVSDNIQKFFFLSFMHRPFRIPKVLTSTLLHIWSTSSLSIVGRGWGYFRVMFVVPRNFQPTVCQENDTDFQLMWGRISDIRVNYNPWFLGLQFL